MTDTPDTIERIHTDLRHLAIPIGELNEDPANANQHNDASLEGIAASFIRFGQRKNIVVRREGMVIEAGNGTLAALKAAGWTHLACSVCDDDEDTAKAYALADNNRRSTWDMNQLAQNVGELLEAEYDLTGLWSDDELKVLADRTWVQPSIGIIATEDDQPAPDSEPADTVAELQAEPADEPEDFIPEPPAEPVTKFGDVIELGPHTLHCADCMDVLADMPDNSVDAIVCDPPYGLSPDGKARTWDDIEALRAAGKSGPKSGFMGSAWDAGVPGITWARECLRVLKPGGHLVAASATRTVHRLTCAVEDAGFEIRDMVAWLQWQGFPKNHNVSEAIDGLHGAEREVIGTDTKARSSSGSSALPTLGGAVEYKTWDITAPATDDAKAWEGWGTALKPSYEPFILSRKPLEKGLTVAQNVLKWGTGAINIDACRHAPGDRSWPGPQEDSAGTHCTNRDTDGRCLGHRNAGRSTSGETFHGPDTDPAGRWPANIYHCPKPATRERAAGCEDVSAKHETVKPLKVIRQLAKLVTPPGGTIFEPFGGSGTILPAVRGLGFTVILAEREPKYMDIVRARGEHSLRPIDDPPRRVLARPGDKVQARRRVQTLIDSGALPKPGDLECTDCGDTTCESPHEYDHYLGYGEPDDAPEVVQHAHETVQAVCALCHHKREAERVAAT